MVDRRKYLSQLMFSLVDASPLSWEGISDLLQKIKGTQGPGQILARDEFISLAAGGSAFITYEYGVDGVSIEIAKYAKSLELLLKEHDGGAIHLIGGDFPPRAETLFKSRWQRYKIQGANGWAKWEGGKWFSALFYEDMPAGSDRSDNLAAEIFTQAITIANSFGSYIVENNISLIIPVNVFSNPGNLAITLAVIFVSEALGLYVIASNHDFYWEGGNPAADKEVNKPLDVRDHFYRNMDNSPFFQLFQSLYPWNGRRWIQANINTLQSKRLIEQFAFLPNNVSELPTGIGDSLFEEFTQADVRSARLRMGYILSDGEPAPMTIAVREHLSDIKIWMQNQRPVVIAAQAGLTLDLTTDDLIYLLQPTRIIARKRIQRDVELVGALLEESEIRKEFESNEERQLVLHITGPVPIEHQADLEVILLAFITMIKKLPESIANRIFLAFSVGVEDHPSLKANNLQPLGIQPIYRMATAVLFPSKTEGRGLPIIEASAVGIPIICSRYQPEQVFAEVVGEGLSKELQIQYTLFPEDEFTSDFLEEVAEMLLHPENSRSRRMHNQAAVRQRYSAAALTKSFEVLLERLRTLP